MGKATLRLNLYPNMDLFQLKAQDKQEWDEFVYQEPAASVYHLWGWKEALETTFNHTIYYLCARERGQIIGGLPLLHIRSRISGPFITSMPGGVCASNEQAAFGLIEKAKELTRSRRAKYLILRDSPQKWNVPELLTNEDHCTALVHLSDGSEKVWRNVKKRARQLTNQATRAGLQVAAGPAALEEFYPIYLQAMRDKGTPTLGLRFFRKVAAHLPEHFNFLMIRREEQILGGGFFAPFRDTIYCTWGGMLRQYYDLHPNHLLYWETIKFGLEHSYQWVDLGRSLRDSGGYIFKMNWGAQPKTLYQQYYLNGITRPPLVGSSLARESSIGRVINFWKKLPLPITEIIGPVLRKRMPFG